MNNDGLTAMELFSQKQQAIVTLRRRVMAAMETGNPSVARTCIRELAELDATAAYALRADVVKSYGMDV